MLTWVEREVESPYGSVRTRHWAVATAQPNHNDNDNDEKDSEEEKEEERLLSLLESAEDQLGAVLWNSNGAALRYLHNCILAGPLKGQRVVELGAGVGCLGIALAMGGAMVCVTDLKELLPLLQHNIERNRQRVQTRSNGFGHCEALEWRWGPSESINIRKRLRKNGASTLEKRGNDSEKEDGVLVTAVVEALRALRQPSLAMRSSQRVFASRASIDSGDSKRKRKRVEDIASAKASIPVHLVILCDALYGNPKDWPSLLYTLSELLETDPGVCRVVNFCEQRVNDVEGPFLKLLDAENKTEPLSNASDGDAFSDTEFVARALIRQCRRTHSTAAASHGTPTPGEIDLEQLNRAILAEVTREKRCGLYQWNFATTTLRSEEEGGGKSDLDMSIRVTEITWKQKEATQRSGSVRLPHQKESIDEHAVHPVAPKLKRLEKKIKD